MKLTISIISPWVLYYLSGSFVVMEFNPVVWHEESRLIYIVASTMSSLGIFTIHQT